MINFTANSNPTSLGQVSAEISTSGRLQTYQDSALKYIPTTHEAISLYGESYIDSATDNFSISVETTYAEAWYIKYYIKSPTATAMDYWVKPNNSSSTYTNWYGYVANDGGAPTAATLGTTGLYLAGCLAAGTGISAVMYGHAILYSRVDTSSRLWQSTCAVYNSVTANRRTLWIGGRWQSASTSTTISSLYFYTSVASGFAAGSRIKLYRITGSGAGGISSPSGA